jgi:hypothetical protein
VQQELSRVSSRRDEMMPKNAIVRAAPRLVRS